MKLLPRAIVALSLVVSAVDGQQLCSLFSSEMTNCFATNLGSVGAKQCWDCVYDALPASAYYCETIEREVCEAMTSCGCGVCSDEIERYLDCWVGALTSGCPIHCNRVTDTEAGRSDDTSAARRPNGQLYDGAGVLLVVTLCIASMI